MFNHVIHLLSHSPEAYAIVLLLALGDAVFPAFPSETALIVAGLLSSSAGDLWLGWVIAAGAVGAFIGDNVSYSLGRFVGRPAQERFLRGARAQKGITWAEDQLETRGGLVLIVGRYVPGGRTAATFTAGLTHFSYPRFATFDAVAALSWATYGSLLGYFGGRFFHNHVWAALLLAFGVAIGITVTVEYVRRLRERA